MNTSDCYVVRKARFYSLSVPYTPKTATIYSTTLKLFRTFIGHPSPLDSLSSEASVGITVPSMATISGLNEIVFVTGCSCESLTLSKTVMPWNCAQPTDICIIFTHHAWLGHSGTMITAFALHCCTCCNTLGMKLKGGKQ